MLRLRTLSIGAAVSATAVFAALGVAPAARAAAPPAVTITGAGAVPGLAPLIVSGAHDAGPATGTVHVVLTMAFRNATALKSLVAAGGGDLTAAQFASQFGPDPAAVAAVTGWATAAGLTVDAVAPNRLLVDVSGTAAQVGAAFGTALDEFSTPTLSYFSPTTTAALPAALAGTVVSVLGLSNLGRATVGPAVKTSSSVSSVGSLLGQAVPAAGPAVGESYGPQQFWSFYDAPAAYTGAGQTMAVLAEGDLSTVITDLRQFETLYGLPEAPVTVKTVDGGSTDTSGQDEFDLDTQYSTGFAPDASLLVYDGRSLNDSDIADEINAFVADDAAKEGSFSAGECEVLADESGLLTTADAALAEAAAQGQTLFTSSGDTGGFCPAVVGVNGVPAGIPNVSYPASSPDAVGVGGTSIVQLPGANEIGWYSGGGGPSLLESQPAWQAGAGGSLLPVQRGVPDVALDADPNFVAFNVIVSGTPTGVGGTSAGAPSWNGIWARAQQAHGGSLGFAGPKIYALPAAAFNDIVLGDNVPFPDTPGWDYVTGRGTPDISAVVAGA
jgi:pseudomonalisin